MTFISISLLSRLLDRLFLNYEFMCTHEQQTLRATVTYYGPIRHDQAASWWKHGNAVVYSKGLCAISRKVPRHQERFSWRTFIYCGPPSLYDKVIHNRGQYFWQPYFTESKVRVLIARSYDLLLLPNEHLRTTKEEKYELKMTDEFDTGDSILISVRLLRIDLMDVRWIFWRKKISRKHETSRLKWRLSRQLLYWLIYPQTRLEGGSDGMHTS